MNIFLIIWVIGMLIMIFLPVKIVTTTAKIVGNVTKHSNVFYSACSLEVESRSHSFVEFYKRERITTTVMFISLSWIAILALIVETRNSIYQHGNK